MKNNIDFSKLNENQYKAVITINGYIQVASCAGSGKTTVLTYRIAHMIRNLGINPENIWVTTFTKKAATEMIERLGKLLTKEEINDLTIGTFHSIGYRILKNEYTIANDPMRNFQLLQGQPVKWLMEEIMKKLNIDSMQYSPDQFINKINDLKMNLISPEAYVGLYLLNDHTKYDVLVQEVYSEYEKIKTERCLIDFNDMIYKAYFLLANNKKILSKYQNRIKYILVDEAQDNNASQYELIELLSEVNKNVFIVGDDDQSIYKFRGAKPEKFIGFQEKYSATIINLEENYRSMPQILEAANSLIFHNKTRVQKELKPFRKAENCSAVPFISAPSEDDEAEIVKNEIVRLSKEGQGYNSMAIIYRTNAQARAIEDALINETIPYVVFNGISFYERAEVKDIIAYLKLAIDPKDNASFKRIINKPSRYLGKKFMEDLEKMAKISKRSLYNSLDLVNVNDRIKQHINEFKRVITTIERMSYQDVGEVIDKLIKTSKYDEYLSKDSDDEEDNIRMENIQSLIKAASKFKVPADFIKYVDLVNNSKKDENIEAVKLMTIHKSKGLEFPNVFVIGMATGLLPHKYAIQEQSVDAIEEERRLAYVAMTRAKDRLLVTAPESYTGKGLTISQFIEEAKLEEVLPEVAVE